MRGGYTLIERNFIMNNKKHLHLTLADRSFIESALKQNHTFTYIAECLDKSISTISKEIRKNLSESKPSVFSKPKNICTKVRECSITNLCNANCHSECKNCHNLCNNICPNYNQEELCELLSRPPYVCNGCDKKKSCRKVKHIYIATNAHNAYLYRLKAFREGANVSEEKLNLINAIVSPLIMNNGQSINHIIANNDLEVSSSTIYRYIDKGYLDAGNLDLRSKLKYKPRKKHKKESDVDYTYAINRTYDDFKDFIANNPLLDIVEMDCVEGVKGGSVLLTFLHRKSGLLLIYKLEKQRTSDVKEAVYQLKANTGQTRFKKYFSIILTDRGSEFKKPSDIEYNSKGVKTNTLFYCDPQRSDQKGMIENAHRLIRFILPKGSSFDNLSDEQINKIMNNINNYSRKELGNKSAYEKAKEVLPLRLLSRLGLIKIPPNEVNLTPSLIK